MIFDKTKRGPIGSDSARIGVGHKLSIDKALRQFALLCKKWSDGVLGSEDDIERWRHDFEVCLNMGNLAAVGIEFYTANKLIVGSLWVEFDAISGDVIDSARSVEVTFMPKGLIAGHRILKRDRDSKKSAAIQHLLKIKWTTAETLQQADGETYGSEHASAITGGWCQAKFFAADLAKHRGLVHFVSPRGDWAKAKDESEMQDVFLHVKHLAVPNGFKFESGRRVQYLLVTTKRGFQARNIRSI